MTDPIQVLRRHRPWRADMPKALGEYDAALAQVEALVEAADTWLNYTPDTPIPAAEARQDFVDALAPFKENP